MTAYEVMLSESQERMLLVAEKGREDEIVRVFEKWDLHAEAIGTVTEGQRLRVFNDGRLEADVPNEALTDEAPALRPALGGAAQPGRGRGRARACAARRPRARAPRRARLAEHREQALDLPPVRLARCAPTRSSGPGSDAAVVRVKGTARALAMSVDGNGRYGWLDPYRRRAAGRGRGLPQRGRRRRRAHRRHELPQLRQPREARGDGPARGARSRGIGDACRALDVPITGGNVSLYNETDGRAIYPTPVIGVVGLIEDAAHVAAPLVPGRRRRRLPARRDRRRPRRQRVPEGRARARRRAGRRGSTSPPRSDCTRCWPKARPRGVLLSAHDLSDGGLAVAAGRVLLRGRGAGPGRAPRPSGADGGRTSSSSRRRRRARS